MIRLFCLATACAICLTITAPSVHAGESSQAFGSQEAPVFSGQESTREKRRKNRSKNGARSGGTTVETRRRVRRTERRPRRRPNITIQGHKTQSGG
jgi:hypothetical protein